MTDHPSTAAAAYDVEAVREAFPILRKEVRNGVPLTYLDNAATSQKPHPVIRAVSDFYSHANANIHRGIYQLSQDATQAYDDARSCIAEHLKAPSPKNLVFTRGATESINLVAQSFVLPRIKAGQKILITLMEHHANIVPWHQVAERSGAEVVFCPITREGLLNREAWQQTLAWEDVAFASVVWISNSLGTINPVHELVADARDRGVPVLVDGAQAVPHAVIDLAALDCDFFVFSGHKVYGPTGIGCLYGKGEHLEAMPPYQGGGDMIEQVSTDGFTFRDPPGRFEAGTPHLAGAIGLAEAIRFLKNLGVARVAAHEQLLLAYATEQVSALDGVSVIGTAPDKGPVLSLHCPGIHPHDIATFCDGAGLAVRAGHHCCMPLMRHLGIPGTARLSFGCYSTRDEVDLAIATLRKVLSFFGDVG
ncbi:MAG: aminotransferase class V-fold PLP-dependent enzyme [Opitutales bacterium]